MCIVLSSQPCNDAAQAVQLQAWYSTATALRQIANLSVNSQQSINRVLKVQVWEHAALQSEFMVGHQSSDDFDPELCYRQATVKAQQPVPALLPTQMALPLVLCMFHLRAQAVAVASTSFWMIGIVVCCNKIAADL